MARLLLLVLALALQACAPVARVVLLPQPGAATGALEVASAKASLVLDQEYATAELSRAGDQTKGRSSAAEVAQRYPNLLSMQPAPETRRLLYFQVGSSALTPESEAALPEIAAEVARRPGGEVIVVGHTDAVGTIEANDALSLQRAQAVRQILVQRGVPAALVETIGRGKRARLVPTADQVAEPRNRRVEIVVR